MNSPSSLSRRSLLASAGAAALTWFPAFRVPARADVPPGFPLPLYRQAYQNWSEEILIEDVPTCAPATPADVVAAANWAVRNGYRVRPKGMGHNWSPILLPAGADIARVILVDTTRHLTAVSLGSSAVTAQAGVTMDALLARMEQAGLGFAAVPAPGDITLGGMLAINAHGSAIPARGETRLAGTSYGSLSNLIRSLTAVVWAGDGFTLRTFQRDDPGIGAFLAHLGRAFVTEVTLEAGANQRLRCQSRYDVQAADVFAAPAAAGADSFASLLDGCGRIEVIWFPFTTVPWIKLWTLSPAKPLFSRQVDAPYNYTFANFVDQRQSDYIERIVGGDVSVTPAFENTEMAIVGSGLITTGTWDIWGWSKNTLLYVQPTTLRIVEAGFAVLTARANVQRVVSEFYARYTARVTAYRAQGRYPMNGPIEIRVTGLDHPAESGVPGAAEPLLSSVRPRPDHPEWDVCVWLDMGTIPGTPSCCAFYREMEQWIFANYSGSYAAVRPEWSKAWALTETAAWSDATMLTSTIPRAVSAGQAAGDGFDAARATLGAHDPHRVFSNAFLDVLLP